MLKGVDKLINSITGMPVHIAENPIDCVAEGTGKVLEDIGELFNVLSSEDNRYY